MRVLCGNFLVMLHKSALHNFPIIIPNPILSIAPARHIHAHKLISGSNHESRNSFSLFFFGDTQFFLIEWHAEV
jgi:hypothetical protein